MLKKIILLAAVATLGGCEMINKKDSDSRSMGLMLEHECIGEGRLKTNAGGSNDEQSNEKSHSVDKLPVR